MFRQADQCAGIDAWRRIVRLIDNSRSIRLQQLRAEMRTITAYPIKFLEGFIVGVAEYQNKVRDFVKAAERQISEAMKSDLAAILPAELGDYMIVRVTDPHQSYEAFREFAVHVLAAPASQEAASRPPRR